MDTKIELATNSELIEEKKQLENRFDDLKEHFYQVYYEMADISQKYHDIEMLLNKREGKINNEDK